MKEFVGWVFKSKSGGFYREDEKGMTVITKRDRATVFDSNKANELVTCSDQLNSTWGSKEVGAWLAVYK